MPKSIDNLIRSNKTIFYLFYQKLCMAWQPANVSSTYQLSRSSHVFHRSSAELLPSTSSICNQSLFKLHFCKRGPYKAAVHVGFKNKYHITQRLYCFI